MVQYTSQFFQRIDETSRASATAIVPALLRLFDPKSVVDVGCGAGVWLSVFQQHGVTDVLGIDGDYVDPRQLSIPAENFVATDLRQSFRLDRRFDLVLSLEVAEHLPTKSADDFVQSLTNLGDIILFSAAIPHQGGTGHINEQWPDYWWDKFAACRFVGLDCLRRQFWSKSTVAWWYAQNMLLYVNEARLHELPALARESQSTPLSLVHPGNLLQHVEWADAILNSVADIVDNTPPGSMLILIDEGQLSQVRWPSGRSALPFPRRAWRTSGLGVAEDALIAELDRQIECGARYLVLLWPVFWWLEYYQQFAMHVRSTFHEVLGNERVMVYHHLPKNGAGKR